MQTTKRLALKVDRSVRNYELCTKCQVYLHPDDMREWGLKAGDAVKITTYWGRNLLGRVTPSENDQHTGIIRLDRFQRQSLQVRLGEEVELAPVTPEPVAKVYIQPAVDLGRADAHHLSEHLLEQFVHDRTLVSPEMLLFARFHHSVAGVIYYVKNVELKAGLIDENTKLVMEPVSGDSLSNTTLAVTFDDIGGLREELAMIREYVQIPLQQPEVYRQLGIRAPRGLIFHGPPGTGKTYLARAISNEFNTSFYYINGPSIVGTSYGETEANLRKIFGEATHHAPSIVMIDELDVIAPKRGATGSHSDTRAVTQLLSLMDGLENTEGVVVIGTTNRLDAIDEALRRPGRFDRELYFGPPDAKARREILEIHTREMPLTDEARKNLDRIAQETVGYVSADIMELCREAGLNALRRSLPDQSEAGGTLGIRPHDLTVTSEDFAEALKRVRPSASRLVLTRSTKRTFQDVIGLKAQKQFIREMVIEPMKNPEILRDFDLVSPEGILLYGPPGTGKTWLASSIAGECGINFIAVDGPELFTKWLGESEETVRYVFSLAKRLAPSVLFFDQLDALVPVRSAGNDSLTADRVVSQLLSELDRLQDEPTRIVVVAATNRPDLVDPSILRPGRIGLKLELAKPDFGERAEIVETMLSRIGQAHLPIAEEALKRLGERIAGQTEGFVTSDLIALCRRAKRRVLSSIRHGAENPAGIEELWMKAFMSEAAVKPEHQPIR